ncbi:TIGR00266 family protein [Rhodospira trueperi]|uniref:TIGR00266 family protein n=1 Tax=Rhodospira trueperi TaxID=69960 RepID=A0A1G7EKS0_9PROT|nr:TIGR00266 family protein [Rhodospira trueperi]SDE64283.1 TIGR00266 family protein [Rhodospira trueperi]
MDYNITHGPAFALLEMDLSEGEQVQCESGAMVSMSTTLTLETSMGGKSGGGFLGRAVGALSRSALGGESFFITHITASDGPGHLALAPTTLGDISDTEVDESTSLILQGGSFLAAAPGVQIDTSWGGRHGIFGGEGPFMLKATGSGTLFMASFGAIVRRDLAPGERFVVDSGHMVAFQEGMGLDTRMVAGAGGFFKRMVTSATSGEGLVMEFTGPGPVWMQTRNADAFAGWIKNLIPSLKNTSSGQ